MLARLPAVCVCTGALSECAIRAMAVIVLRLGVGSRAPAPTLTSQRPLPPQDLPAPSKRCAAVVTLGQVCQSAGSVMTPYWDFPPSPPLVQSMCGCSPPLPTCHLQPNTLHVAFLPPPLCLQDLPAPSKRRAAVVTLGQICQSAGSVMTPYWDFPQLLSLLLKLLADNRPQPGSRCEVMRVLGEGGVLVTLTWQGMN